MIRCTVSHKKSVVRTLTTRASTLSFSWIERAKEEKKFMEQNGYPPSFLHKYLHPSRWREDRNDQRPRTTLTLPYINGLFEAVRRILSPLDNQVAFCPLSILDTCSCIQQNSVVYCVPCDGCPRQYIGQMGSINWQNIDGTYPEDRLSCGAYKGRGNRLPTFHYQSLPLGELAHSGHHTHIEKGGGNSTICLHCTIRPITIALTDRLL